MKSSAGCAQDTDFTALQSLLRGRAQARKILHFTCSRMVLRTSALAKVELSFPAELERPHPHLEFTLGFEEPAN